MEKVKLELEMFKLFNYLRAELDWTGTNSNYEVAVNLLQERFGRDELVMDVHYSSLIDLPVSLNVTMKLRAMYDMNEKHLRSLKALGENVDQAHFVFLTKSKLPKVGISRMEEYRHGGVESIRKALKRYICTQEVG